jgi:hypothetical protein
VVTALDRLGRSLTSIVNTVSGPGQARNATRAKDSNDKRRRVRLTLKAMKTAGRPIPAAAVAAAAGVSTWLVYADGIRERRLLCRLPFVR